MNKALDIWFRSDLRNWSCEGLEITPCSRKWWHWTCWGWCCCPFRAFNKLGILPLVPKKYTSPMGTAILGTSTNRQLLRWLIHLEVDVGLLRQQKLRPEEVPESSSWRPRSSYPMRFSWYLRISHLTCFFWGGILASRPITHRHFSGTYRLHRTSEKSKHIKLGCSADTMLIPFASFFWMDGLFVLPPIFAVSLVPPFCFAKTLPKKQISNDFRCGFPRRVQLTSKEQLVKTQLSLDLRLCGSWWLGGVEVYFVDSLMSQDLRHNSLTFLTIVSKGLQFLTNNLGHDCSLTRWVQSRDTSTGENASNFKMVHMWEREWPGWHFGTLLSCDHCQSDEFSTLDQTQHQVLNLQWECTIYFCKPLSSLFLVFVLEICQFPRLVTSLELPCCFFWVELVLIHLYKIIGSLRHPKHFNIFGVAEVAVCLVVPWKLNVTYMERVMRLKNSIVTYPSFQE